jgi:5-methyltetrahydrofolate--homocysteine methyltransferase
VLLKKIIKGKLLEARAIVGLYPANSVGDDIHVYESETDTKPTAILYGLRQQQETEAHGSYQCISDFVAPLGSGKKDYIGIFATCAGFGSDELCSKYDEDHDDFNSIMVRVLW